MVFNNKKILILTILVGVVMLGVGVMRSTDRKSSQKQHRSIDRNAYIKKENVWPIVIIGSGPAGLAAATYGARAHIDTLIIEGNEPGGLLTKTTEVENWPGAISVLGPDIVSSMKKQAQNVGAYFLNDAVENVDFDQWPFKIMTENEHEIFALSVIISTGANPRKLNIPGEEEYWGLGVTSCAVCDAPFFKGEDVVVIGGGDSAVEEATYLSQYVKSVTIMVRKDHMRAAKSMQKRIGGYSNITILYNKEIQEICGDGNKVTHIKVHDNKNDSVENMSIGGVFLAIGHNPNTELFNDTLETVAGGYIKVYGRGQETSVPGVFAAGDVEDHTYRQAGVAAGSGIKAALDAITFLNDTGFNEHIAEELTTKLTLKAKTEHNRGTIEKIEDESGLNELIAHTNKTVVVDFYADYCPSCMKMLPIFEEVASEFKDDVVFAKVDANEGDELLKELDICTIPCLLVYKDGELIDRYNDAMSKKELVQCIKKHT